VGENTGAKSFNNWATALLKGPADESTQNLDFIVTNNNNSLFSVQPAISPVGDLTFTLAANVSGQATVTVAIHDDGGVLNGGVDTSATQTFIIRVVARNQLSIVGNVKKCEDLSNISARLSDCLICRNRASKYDNRCIRQFIHLPA
jgi:hypothetical protein